MSPRDLVDEGIAAGALEWVPNDHDTAPPAGAYAPPADRVVTTAPAFDGCYFCLAPSADAREAQRRAAHELNAAILWLDAVRDFCGSSQAADERGARMQREALAAVERYARELVEVIG